MRPEEQTLTCRAMDMAPQHEEGGARGGARPQNQPPQAAADLRGASEAGQAVVAQVQRGQLAAGAQVGEHADVVAREVQVLRARAGPQAAAVSSLHPGPGTLRKAQHTCEGADLYTLTRLHQACMPSRAVQDEGASGCPPGLCIMHSLLTGRVLSPTTRSLGQATIGLPPPQRNVTPPVRAAAPASHPWRPSSSACMPAWPGAAMQPRRTRCRWAAPRCCSARHRRCSSASVRLCTKGLMPPGTHSHGTKRLRAVMRTSRNRLKCPVVAHLTEGQHLHMGS